jgi:hypothetical protein
MMVKNTGLRVLEFSDGGRIDIGFPGDRRSGLFWGKKKSHALLTRIALSVKRQKPLHDWEGHILGYGCEAHNFASLRR